MRLYLNRDYQVYSGVDEYYHEWFVHAPVQAVGKPPRRALVLGGGDGLALRELVAYESLERIVHVELDPVMTQLAAEHPSAGDFDLADVFRTLHEEFEKAQKPLGFIAEHYLQYKRQVFF